MKIGKADNRDATVGINIQINTLIDAMIDAERCLFHNSDANLMVNSLNKNTKTNESVSESIELA